MQLVVEVNLSSIMTKKFEKSGWSTASSHTCLRLFSVTGNVFPVSTETGLQSPTSGNVFKKSCVYTDFTYKETPNSAGREPEEHLENSCKMTPDTWDQHLDNSWNKPLYDGEPSGNISSQPASATSSGPPTAVFRSFQI